MVGLTTADVAPTAGVKVFSAGAAGCVADLVTFPLDTAKVRLQIQGECRPSLEVQKNRYRGAGLGTRLLAGCTTGAMAVTFAQPTDVVKVRFQAQSRLPESGSVKRYSGTMDAYRTIARDEGVKGLWKGCLPNIARNAIVNCSELVTYDIIKELILKNDLMTDNMPCHFTAAFAAGFCTTIVASPVDVVKTRYMNSVPGQYSGAMNCAVTMLLNEGTTAFYKGFMPAFLRLGSWNIVMFVSYEQIKRAVVRFQL
ncbi:mitochondrial uncoupling protein 2-like isoform X2 [Sparus aurata]|uniref:mitochondrial uncoupling protein 2-like isoform X2 n=1 Tax=Sparus aurata TaxID=8175 RepID=UPI0011C18DEB|nr:mitochondrial uncoupling protein 2-like isoform X2 [Sparus aurata]